MAHHLGALKDRKRLLMRNQITWDYCVFTEVRIGAVQNLKTQSNSKQGPAQT